MHFFFISINIVLERVIFYLLFLDSTFLWLDHRLLVAVVNYLKCKHSCGWWQPILNICNRFFFCWYRKTKPLAEDTLKLHCNKRLPPTFSKDLQTVANGGMQAVGCPCSCMYVAMPVRRAGSQQPPWSAVTMVQLSMIECVSCTDTKWWVRSNRHLEEFPLGHSNAAIPSGSHRRDCWGGGQKGRTMWFGIWERVSHRFFTALEIWVKHVEC